MIFTGCPRSGTMTVAHVFGVLHERQYVACAPDTPPNPMVPISESSWYAAAFVQCLRVPVIHIVRDPRCVLASLLRRDFFNDDNVSWQWVRRIMPKLVNYGKFTAPAAFMYAWNDQLRCKCTARIKIEDIADAPITNASKDAYLEVDIGPYTAPPEWRQVLDQYVTYGYKY